MSQASLFSLFLYRRYLASEMGDDCLNVSLANQSGDVSLYLSTPERMVSDSFNVHLTLMSARCVHMCV